MAQFLGILLLVAGGFSAASFYVPSHAIKKWTWETYRISFGTGTTKLGEYSYAGWSIFMAAIISFSNLWGLVLKEWKGGDAKTRMYLWMGIIALVVSVVMIGVGDGLARVA